MVIIFLCNELFYNFMETKIERFKNKLLTKILSRNNSFEQYYTDELEHLSINTQANNLNALNQFFLIIDKYDANEINQNDIRAFKNSEKFKNLKPNTKNSYIVCVKKYLEKYGKNDIANETLKRYNIEENEIDKNELVTREELDIILKCVDVGKRAMIMVNYEGALRRNELVSIRFGNVVFVNNSINL